MNGFQILQGDALTVLRTLPDKSVHCCVTSPPYWGLRDYGVAGQIGLENTPDQYVRQLTSVFAEVMSPRTRPIFLPTIMSRTRASLRSLFASCGMRKLSGCSCNRFSLLRFGSFSRLDF